MKTLKKVGDVIKDNFLQILELVIAVLAAILVPKFGFYLFKMNQYPGGFFDFILTMLLFMQKKCPLVVGIAIIIITVVIFHLSINKDKVMCRGNAYHNYPYFWYVICAKILGFKKCNIVLVPVYLQVRLIINEVFDTYYINEYEVSMSDLIPKVDFEYKVSEYNELNNNNKFNIVIADTYPIKEDQIPDSLKGLHTYMIYRLDEDNKTRLYSPKFVDEINQIVRKLPNGSSAYFYMSTNPVNTKMIAEKVIKQANRGNLEHAYVLRQEDAKNNWKFTKAFEMY